MREGKEHGNSGLAGAKAGEQSGTLIPVRKAGG